MGFLDALTADAYPRDSQGRRVWAPYGARGKAYILPTERAERRAGSLRLWFRLFFVALLVGAIAAGPWGIWLVAVIGIIGGFVEPSVASRGLEESTERPTLSRDERVRRSMHAMGRSTMVAICLGGAASAVAGMWLLIRGERSIAVWFITTYGGVIAGLYARQLSRSSEGLSAR
jgi:uncharacterized membrane protein